MTGKLLVLTGAPESRRLDWTTPGLLLSSFQPSIARFAQLQPRPSHPPQPLPTQDTSALGLAVWRTLPLVRTHIPTGFSQQHDLHLLGAFPSSADFLNTASISLEAASQPAVPSQDEDEDAGLLAEFYEHSLAAAHGSCQPRQDPAVATSDASFVSDTNSNARSFTSEDETTANTTTTFFGGDTTTALKTPLRPGWAGGRGAEHLSDLEDIPPAAYLLSVAPQTVTVTLVAGIISIAAPRAVDARRGRGGGRGGGGAPRTLVEVLVGDETKSGFAVTFWLSGADAAGMGEVLAGLRGQDVVLMQNVALNVFRGKVYGGSLGRGMTRVHLLYRAKFDEGDVGGYYSRVDLAKVGREGPGRPAHPQLEKTRRVRDWVLKFVGGGAGIGEKTSGKHRKGKKRVPPLRQWNQPPPLDSQ